MTSLLFKFGPALALILALLVACQSSPTPEPPTATPASAPTATPWPVLGPEANDDRVGFPEGYETTFDTFYVFDRPDNMQVRAVYANSAAANARPGEPFLTVLYWSWKPTERSRTSRGTWRWMPTAGSSGIRAEALIEHLRPRVVLMDLRMPRRDGVEATRRIVARWPDVAVLVLTTYDDDELVFRSIQAGASGYLLKDVGSDALAEAVRAASRGESPLQPTIARKVLKRLQTQQGVFSPSQPGERPDIEKLSTREMDVLRLLGTGATNREIAQRLSLTEGTVKNYISAILAKTDFRDRTNAALYAIRQGLVSGDASSG